MQQFRDQQFNQFRDAFTITPNELEHFIERLYRYLEFLKTKSQAAAANSAAAQDGLSQGPVASTTASSPPQVPGANANASGAGAAPRATGKPAAAATAMARPASERRPQQQVPAAPITTQPPFPLGGSPPPDGVPRFYGEQGLTSDKLKQPPTKRRKANAAAGAAAGSPAEGKSGGTASASPVMGKGTETKAKNVAVKAEPVVDLPHKCPVADCAFHRTGFASVEALGAHQQETHEVVEETVENPEQYFLEHLAESLGLNEDGSSKVMDANLKPVTTTTGGTKMTATPSRTGQTPSAKPETNISRGVTRTESTRTPAAASIRTAGSTQSVVVGGGGGSSATAGATAVATALPEKPSEMQREESIQPFKGLLTPPSGWDLCDLSLEAFKTTLEKQSGEQMLTPRDTPASSSRGLTKKGGGDEGGSDNEQGGELGETMLAAMGDVAANDGLSFEMDPFGLGDGLGGFESVGGMDSGLEGSTSMMDWESPLNLSDTGIGSDWLGTFGSMAEFDGNMFTIQV